MLPAKRSRPGNSDEIPARQASRSSPRRPASPSGVEAVARTYPRARVAFHDVVNRLNRGRVIACLVPARAFPGEHRPVPRFLEDDPAVEAACLGVLNSLAFDWQARRFVEMPPELLHARGHCRCPCSRPRTPRSPPPRPVCRVLMIASRDFAAGASVECGPISDDAASAQLRADIDARVARAWELEHRRARSRFAGFQP